MQKLKIVLAVFAASMWSSTVSAGPASVDIKIRAHVPVSCSASLNRNVVQVSTNEYKIGRLNRSCNTPHRVTMNSVSGINGTLRMDGQTASIATGQAVVTPFSRAKRGRADIFLSGVTRTEASQIAQSLSISLAPTGT